jgi:hypothetical protein
MRKIAWVILMMLLLMPFAAWAEGLTAAAPVDLYKAFERYQSYKMDEGTGEWSAYGLIASQLLNTVERGGARGYTGDGVCLLYPGVRGSRDLALAEPVLYVCLVRGTALGADALNVTAGGFRYDFTAAPEKTKIGAYACERFTLPLNRDGLKLLRDFAASGGEVQIYSDKRTFRTSIHEADSNKNAKQRVEALSIAAARDFLTQFPDNYALWDLNEAHWSKDRPQMTAMALRSDAYAQDLPALEPSTQCLDNTKRAAIKQYQQMLRDGAFLTANPGGTFGKATRDATKQAQKFYGLLPTGMPDRALIERLAGASPETDESAETGVHASADEAIATYQEDGVLSIRIYRAWIARALSPSLAADSMNWVWPADRSNRLMNADGEAVNLSGQVLQIPLAIQAELVFDGGATYPCTLQLERDEGQTFGSELLPLGKCRLALAAEIPASLTDLSKFSLVIRSADARQSW